MKIVQIIPGVAGAFYCQNCMRDREFVMELRARGHDVVMAPMYLPVFSEGEDIAQDVPVFYGAVSVYLSQYLPRFLRLPQFIKRFIDSRHLLRWIAGKAGTMRASGLEGMTLSVLAGENGEQKEDLDQLLSWLKKEGKPDIVHLSNALLIGLAKRIKDELGVSVVCTLQDEDSWINSMDSSAAREVWQMMNEKSSNIAAFLPVSKYYSRLMQEHLGLDAKRFHVVPIGINTEGYLDTSLSLDAPVIGYLSRMTRSLGLEVLVDAFMMMKVNNRLKNLRLRVMGGQTREDVLFLKELKQKLEKWNMQNDVDFLENFGRQQRIEFLKSLSILTVPMLQPEAFGMFMLESMASGVPVVQPRIGAFPEIIEATGGGVCYDPNDAVTLAKVLENTLMDRKRLEEMGRAGREAVRAKFSVKTTAESVLEVYRNCL